ncbi:PAS domain S-box protein [Ramlibacter henchirensis]|uniref:histidine kinase n=1 Tax=Ramlibacter henchirensis TaxID=204072 RepID=A0A4Z0BPJ6_9BURK|nr:PAS domain S-box protein [Ramlibacter henchirensis]TFZ00682.1 PAS domain S-box protein [Ramlibacter henchirensis]
MGWPRHQPADITGRQRTGETSHELQELWRVAFEANPTMYFIVDEAGAIVSVNRLGAQQLGYAVGELVGQPVLNVFFEPDRAIVQKNADNCLRHPGRSFRWEARKVRKDGTMLWVRETANAVLLPDNRPVLLVGCEDVTERKHAEQALRDSEERFRTLVEFSFDVYWESDAQHRFTRQEYGPELADAPARRSELGKTRWEVPYLEPDEEAWRRHRATLDAHLPFRDFELARPTPDGGKRYVSVSGLPVFDETGAFVGYRGVGRHITESKLAEQALRQREKELREIVETMPAMVFVADASGRNSMGNRRWLEYAGLAPGAVGSPAPVHPDDDARYRAARAHSIATGEPFEQEVRLRRFDGEYRWFLSRAVPLRDDQGRILKWYGVLTDIHDRKVAEEERAAHVWFLERMDRINRAMQGTNDLEQMTSDVLDAVLEVFGCDRAWLVYPCDPGAPSWKAVMEHTRPQFSGAFALGADVPLSPDTASTFRAALAAEGAALVFDPHGLQVTASAERFGVLSQVATVVRPRVDRPYLFGLHQCSHARVWSEPEKRLVEEIGRRLEDVLTSLLIFRSLRESERKLEEAQRIGRMGYFEYDLGTQSLTLSDEACRIYGVEQHQLSSWQGRVLELVHAEDRDTLTGAIAAAAGRNGRFAVEFRALRPDGEVRIVHSRGEATGDAAQGLRAFGTLQDITQLRNAQEALRDAEAALARANRVTTLGVLAASIAHEVNQPLGAITTSAASCARWLAAEPPQMEKARSALQRIGADGKRAAHVVDRIRALVNRQAPRTARLDLGEAILEVVALTRNEVRRNAIVLDTSLAPDVPPIEGDRVQLQQVVLNLIVNAVEAMSGSGPATRELAIASSWDGANTVTVEVRDSGPGVDPDRADRLFEPFYTSKADGIGMGLSISRSIIEAHGGWLSVTPNLPSGAVFRFSLPVDPPVS